MRVPLFLFFVVFATSLFGQASVDSIAIVKQVDSLLREARAMVRLQRNFDKAFEIQAVADTLALGKMGSESAAYGYCCFNRAAMLANMPDFIEAEKWFIRSKIIREKALGKEHPDYATSLHNLATVYYYLGDYEKALPLYLESKAIRAKALGVEHPDYAGSLNSLAILYMTTGDYEKAEQVYLECKSIQENTIGKEDFNYAKTLHNMAVLYRATGAYEKSETLFLEAMAIQSRAPGIGTKHPEYARSLYNLAILYMLTGDYEKSEPFYLEAIVIREKVLGKEHPDYAASINNLALLYTKMGRFDQAEPLYLEAKSIQEKKLGKEHPEFAFVLSNLADFYYKLGNYEKAEQLFLNAIALQKQAQRQEHPDYASSLSGLAVVYVQKEAYEKAIALLIEALAVQKKVIGNENTNYAIMLMDLASIYTISGDYEIAERVLLEAQTVLAKVLGKEDVQYASCLANLGSLYQMMGAYEKAEANYLQSKVIIENKVGKQHPDYAENIFNLASLYEQQHLFSPSEPLLSELFALEQQRMSKSVFFLSEMELSQYMLTFQHHGNYLNAYILARSTSKQPTGNLLALAYEDAIFYKGFLLNAVTQLNYHSVASPESREIYLRLKVYHRRLAVEYAKPIAERKNVDELEEKANTAEKELARTVAGYTEATQQVSWQEVQSALKPGEAAIEFIHFRLNFPKKTDSTMYAALVLLPAGAPAKEGLPSEASVKERNPGNEQPIFVPLFEEKDLQNLIKTSGARKSDYVNSVYSNQKTTEKSLYELVWQPLEKALTDTKTVYFSPSGLLHRLNLNAIPIHDKETLSDRYHLVEVGSTRQLVISPESNESSADVGNALLLGGVQYDLNSDSSASKNIDLESNITGTRGDLNFSFTDSTDRGGSWNYLKWTDKEVTALEPILKSAQIKPTVLKGYTATEEAFKSIGSTVKKSPRILHIATHGYFFPDPKETTKGSALGLGAESVFKLSDHPMIRSGLILAGANQAWKTGKPFKPGMEDGILTAYEISQMDLSNTELVVLSACETGLGDIQGNEGVYGLQRAFKIAGAKYLIMSLWQVPDFQTQELMTTFYTNWLTKKQPIPDAFRAAQQAMRKKYEHPYFWAGFVLVE